MNKTTIATGGTAIIALMLAIIANYPNLIDSTDAYVCLEPQLAMECDKTSTLSAKTGLITRCYFNDGTKNTYKLCKTGWVKWDSSYAKKETIELSKDPIYLVCERENKFIKECQIIDENRTIFKVD